MIVIPFKDVEETLKNLSPFCSVSYEDNLGQKHLLTKTTRGYVHATSGMGSVHVFEDKDIDIERAIDTIKEKLPEILDLFDKLSATPPFIQNLNSLDTNDDPIFTGKRPATKKAAVKKSTPIKGAGKK